ncbi:hypothetical protein, partial [Nitrosomonas sp.]|uniref:hypothetical protein n=1 Tax=Nitrosomonas sp. TaxID=42353 RepID=UPI0035B3CDA5
VVSLKNINVQYLQWSSVFNYADYILSQHYAVLYLCNKNWQLTVLKVYPALIIYLVDGNISSRISNEGTM